MIKEKNDTQIILKADEGKYLTDGESYGRTLIAPKGSDVSVWYEITKEEYEAIQTSLETTEVEANV